MKKQSKSILILLVTLLIGIAIGVLGSRVYTLHKIKDYKTEKADIMFERLFMRIVQPTPEQTDTLRIIWDKYQEKLQANHKHFFTETKTILDSMFKEMAPLLTDEQKQRLKERRHRDRRPPHFPGRTLPGHKPGEHRPPHLPGPEETGRPAPPDELFLE